MLVDRGLGFSRLFLGCGEILGKAALIGEGEEKNTGQQNEERNSNVRFHWPASFDRHLAFVHQ